ncbi:MAG: hypothetical protein AAF211_15360, partial [Myxococcota bacterium]
MTATERPGDLVRRAALLSIGLTVATVPFLWMVSGWPWAAFLFLVVVPGFLLTLRRSVLGDVKAASQTFLTVTTLVVACCVLLTGGFFGWGVLLVVNLPMSALLVGIEPWRDAVVVVRRMAILVVLVYLLPDYQAVALDGSTMQIARVGIQMIAVAFAGFTATHALHRLESAVGEAQRSEQEARSATGRKQTFLANIS